MLRLQPALQLVGQTADGAFQRFELLIEIGPKTLKLLRLCQIFGSNFLIKFRAIDHILRVCVRNRLRCGWLQRRFALRQLHFLTHIAVGHVIHRDLRGRGILLLVLALLWIGIILLFSIIIFAGAVWLILLIVFGVSLILGVLVFEIGIVPELVPIAQIANDLAGEFCKLCLIR